MECSRCHHDTAILLDGDLSAGNARSRDRPTLPPNSTPSLTSGKRV